MTLNEFFFGITSESPTPFDINLTRGEFFYNQFSGASIHRTSKNQLIRINNGSSSEGLKCQGKHCFGTSIFNHFNFDNPNPLQDAKYGDLVKCASASIAFSSATKVSLIKLNLSVKKLMASIGVGQNAHSDHINTNTRSAVG